VPTHQAWSRAARVVAIAAVVAAILIPSSSAAAVERPPGTGAPPKGSGINTPEAYANPACVMKFSPYGRMGVVSADEGPVCLAPWKGGDNGGATYKGVTKDSIKVVALTPNSQQLAALGSRAVPTNIATSKPGTVPDALADNLAGYEHALGKTYTAGRDIDLQYVESTGNDDTAQNADAVAVLAKKPFLVLDVAGNLSAFDAQIAAAKTPVFSSPTVQESAKQAPYRWGQQDNTAAMINGAEFVGKQLAGKKAEYAGDVAMHNETRKFGLVLNTVQDPKYFYDTLAKYKVKLQPGNIVSYAGSSAQTGDPVIAQEQAPVAITKLKQAGVTTVLLLADAAMVTALTKQATSQDYHPEWIYLGSGNIDFPLLARGYDQSQWAHAFGLANVTPGTPATATPTTTVVQWYWGDRGTDGTSYRNAIRWLMYAIAYAGPTLTPQTLKQGWFAVPAQDGSASTDTVRQYRSTRSGYGHTNGLPYEEYSQGNKDFAVTWWDPKTFGPPTIGFPGGEGTGWYLDTAKRYYAGDWPTKPMKFFDKSNSIYQFDTPVQSSPVLPCNGCPSETGQGTPGASSS
jgi:hypothetical protein